METIMNTATRIALSERVQALSDQHMASWGKMNVLQMISHCILFEEMTLGKTKYKQVLLGKLFGKMALRDFMKDKPIRKNTPTAPELIPVLHNESLDQLKTRWVALLSQYEAFSNHDFIHPFFGKLKAEQIGILAY
ncbi:MAG: DUF1569 domain-containing protein, partial [Sphingobacteriales bacterium]